MKMTTIKVFCGALVALLLGTSTVWAAKRRKAPAKVATPLTETGKALQKQYTAQIASLKAELEKAVPAVDPQKKATYLKAIETEKSAKAALDAAKKNLGAVGRGHALVGHAKGKWIGGADKGIASTRAKLKNAKTDAERKALQEQLVKWQKNREDGVKALKERQKILDEALAKEPELKKAEYRSPGRRRSR